MKFHIVRNKETLEDILYIYNLTKDELIEQNKHIRVWDKLIPGTKLKIPPITEANELEVADMEPFVEDYYPTINEDIEDIKLDEIKDDYKKLDDESEDNNKSSNIYEDYEESIIKKVSIKKEEEKEEEKDEEELNYFSNKTTKPVFNNFYPYYLGVYNTPRYIAYPIIYYPVYYPKKPNN